MVADDLAMWGARASATMVLTSLSCNIPVSAPDGLTHWGQDKMAAIFQTTFSNAFSWMKMYKFQLRFHWSLFLRVQLTIFQHWFRYWLGAGQATSHYLNQWWLLYWWIYASLGLNELTSTAKCCGHFTDILLRSHSSLPTKATLVRTYCLAYCISCMKCSSLVRAFKCKI